ncbi:riboflavin synthase [Marinicella sp. W31]|uniref:riboflavin synthase n=1 Tax=Marinicella sp. W31 TaxID=3023713 RepID=UPI00375644A9
MPDMFTGIIQSVGQLQSSELIENDLKVIIDTGTLDMSDVQLGDSIAVDGICLTVTAFDDKCMQADVSIETMNKTTVANWQPGCRLNLEKSLSLGDRLGGHMVSGHVDAITECLNKQESGRSWIYEFAIPEHLYKYLVVKGSVTINGTSLTVNLIDQKRLSVNLVAHTLENTNLGDVEAGDQVNIEIDMIARYVEKMME